MSRNIRLTNKKTKVSALLSALLLSSTIGTIDVNAVGVITDYTGELTTDEQFYRPSFNPPYDRQLFVGDFTLQTTNLFNYSSTLLTPSVTGLYDIETINSNLSSGTDTFLLLYSSFDPDNPLDNLIVANDDGGVDVYALLDDVSLTANTDYTLVVTTYSAGVTGTIDYQVVGPGSMIFLALNSSYYDQTVAGNGQTPAQRNALRLDNFIGTGMDDFKDALDGATDEEVAQAIDELAVKLAGAGVGAAKQTAQAIAKIIRERQNGFIGANSGEEMFTERNFWFKPFGTWGKQKDKGDQNGYDVDTYGFGIGVDGTNKDDQQFGAAFFYNNSDVEVNDADQGADIDGYTLMGYGSIPVIDAKTKFLYQLSYSWQKTDTTRDTVLGTAKADYTSKVGSIDLSLMRDYQINEQWLLQPTVGVTYTHFTTPSYSESGAGVAGSDVDKFTTSEFLFNIGTKANYKIDDSSKFITTLDLNYDMQDKNDSISATTQGGLALEDTKSIDNGRFGFAVGLGYEKELTNNSNINFTYEYAGEGSRYSTNTISAKYVLTF